MEILLYFLPVKKHIGKDIRVTDLNHIKMQNTLKLALVGVAVIVSLAGCGGAQKLAVREPAPKANPETLKHVINGTIASLIGTPKDALVEYHQAAEIDSTSPSIFLALAENYFLLEEYQSSVRLAQKTLRLDPENMDALELLAANYEKLGRLDAAAAAYEKMLQWDPYNIETYYYLISLQILSQKHDVALRNNDRMLAAGFDDPGLQMQIGNLFLQSKAIPQAETVYHQVLKTHPEIEDVYLALATISKAKRDTIQTMDWYKRALLFDPTFDDAREELRVLYEKSKNWDDAIVFFSRLAEKTGSYQDKLAVGQFYFEKQDSLKALGVFQDLARDYPKREGAYLALGALQRILQNDADALATYRTALSQNSSFLTVRRRLRDMYVEQKNWDSAIALYEPLKDSDSTFVGARLEITNLLLLKGDTLAALQQSEPLIANHGDDWRVPYTVGRIYYSKREHGRASAFFTRTIELQKDIPQLWALRGVNYIQMDSLNRAVQNFQEALSAFPNDPEINYLIGTVYSQQKRFDQAIVYLSKSYKLEPDNEQNILALCGAYDELKMYQQSEPLYEKLLQLDPDRPILLNNFAYHLSLRNVRLDEALVMSQKAVAAEPENAAYLDTIGWIYYQLGEYEKAKSFIEQSLELRPDSAEVADHLGDVYFKLGDRENAEKYWRQALQADHNRKEILEKLK